MKVHRLLSAGQLSADSWAPTFERTTIERGNIWAPTFERRLLSADFWAQDYWAQDNWAPTVERRLLSARQLSAATFERRTLSTDSWAPTVERMAIVCGQWSADFWAPDTLALTFRCTKIQARHWQLFGSRELISLDSLVYFKWRVGVNAPILSYFTRLVGNSF